MNHRFDTAQLPAQNRDRAAVEMGGQKSGHAERLLGGIRGVAPAMLRLSLALVFVWFGALKVFGLSPVGDLVAATIPLPESVLLPILGLFEVAVGVTLALGNHPAVATLAAAHLAGTFLVLIIQPEVAFQNGNPLLLTTEGEFVMKNVVLLAAALTLAAVGRGNRRPRLRYR